MKLIVVAAGRPPWAGEFHRRPFAGTPPKNPEEHAAQWADALQRTCPKCGSEPELRCFSLSPSFAVAGINQETKYPHPERLS